MAKVLFISASTSERVNNCVLYNAYFNNTAFLVYKRKFENVEVPSMSEDFAMRVIFIGKQGEEFAGDELINPWARCYFDFDRFDEEKPREKRDMVVEGIRRGLTLLNDKHQWGLEQIIGELMHF